MWDFLIYLVMHSGYSLFFLPQRSQSFRKGRKGFNKG